MSSFQDEDGGFGDGREPDCWNPNLLLIQTWTAAEIMKGIKLNDKNNPIVQGIWSCFLD